MWKLSKLRRKFTRRKISDCLERHINKFFVYLDIFGRWATQRKLGDIFDNIEILCRRIYNYMTADPDEEDIDKFCVDQDGLHFKGESWQNKGQCNMKKCVSHDNVRETRCPSVPEKKGCKIKEEDVTLSYPACCASAVCEEGVRPPVLEPAPEFWWKDQSYKYFFAK